MAQKRDAMPDHDDGPIWLEGAELERARAAYAASEERDAYWREHYDRFMVLYPDQFVAVKDRQVVATAPDLDGIVNELKALGLKPTQAWVEYIAATPQRVIL